VYLFWAKVGLPGSDDPSDDTMKSSGSFQIFDLANGTESNGTEWKETFQDFGIYSNAELGTTVALSEDGRRVAVGAPSYDSEMNGYVVSLLSYILTVVVIIWKKFTHTHMKLILKKPILTPFSLGFFFFFSFFFFL
jgi:hypothetical protein